MAQRYWRGPVLGRYDGRTWTELQPPLAASPPLLWRAHGAPLRYQVTLEPHGQRWLFALEMPAAAPQLDGNPARIGEYRELLATRAISQRVRYDAVSYVDFELEPTEPVLLLQSWLQLPPGRNPRTLEFAQRLRRQTSDDAQRLRMVLNYFRTEEFRYTLNPPPLGDDGVDEFLFSTRAGFCEHYAGAFVVLMRATGYPGARGDRLPGRRNQSGRRLHDGAAIRCARLGRGLARRARLDARRSDRRGGAEPDRDESCQRAAAALAGRPAPFRRRPPVLAGVLAEAARQLGCGEQCLEPVGAELHADSQRNLLQSLGFREPDWRMLTALLALVMGVLLAVMIVPQLRQRGRVDAADALYSALSRRMARHGLARAIHEGPQAYCLRLTAAQSPLAAGTKIAAAQFLQLYQSWRYGALDDAAGAAGTRAVRAAILARLKTLYSECR